MYTRNFEIRDFTAISRSGRNKVPKDDADWVIGTGVVIDADNPGLYRRPTDSENPHPGCGLLVFEHIQYQGDDPFLTTYSDKDLAPNGSYAYKISGPQVKVALRNTDTKELYDGRSQTGRTMIAGLGATPTVAVGDFLTVATDGTFKEGDATNGWLYVEQVNAETGLVECRFTF